MGIKIKNLQTGEFEKFNIPALKGEKGEPGEIEPSEKVDYIGKQHSKLRDTMNANVDYAVKTAIGEFNYLDYEGQHITATNSIEGHARSAILSGRTLVNVIDCLNINNYTMKFADMTITDGYVTAPYVSGNQYITITKDKMPLLKANTEYTVIVEIKDMSCGGMVVNHSFLGSQKNIFTDTTVLTLKNIGIHAFKRTTKSELDDTLLSFCLHPTFNAVPGEITFRFMLLEGDYTNVDIPYFEGMQSVKMPVLSTANTDQLSTVPFSFFEKPAQNKIGWCSFVFDKGFNGRIRVKLKPDAPSGFRFVCFASKETAYGNAVLKEGIDIEVNNASYIGFHDPNNGIVTTNKGNLLQLIKDGDVQITLQEKGKPVIYAYKDIDKTNILSCNEDVELRGIGDVKDELNLLTGEVVRNIGEVVVDGSENFVYPAPNVYRVLVPDVPPRNDSIFVCDTMPTTSWVNYSNESYDGYVYQTREGFSFIQFKRTEEEFKEFLQKNPITIQYQLKENVIKTVDLSDNHVYSYGSTTHYSCSSEEGSLVPTLSVKVPTDTQLTIQEQKATTQTLLIKNMDLQQSIKEVQAMNLAFNTALYNSFNSIREEVEDIKKHVSTNENLEGSF